MSTERKNQKPFMIYMPTEFYEEFKKHCKDQDIPMSKYVLRSLVMRMNLERQESKRIKY